ncbi:OTU domain-containing protein [Hibiscus syriacus]|uniref:Ubiquitin thioesterase OTU n=1 Tax=Hibiscus syriacus TaxID=106335 RepID=A0A6A3B6T5_HIBSY|nr:deubiquitinase OTUD6B-like [Hibiscus syriacus]KAE8711993.1 OTU domain-containing protein [Hibiscus syriacus]
MIGVLCARPPKPWILNALTLISHGGGSAAHHHDNRLLHWPRPDNRRCGHHTTACQLGGLERGAASIWHAILPCGGDRGGVKSRGEAWKNVERRGEGSWNVAWDARPARWLHRPDSAWLLFGVCACLAPMVESVDVNLEDDFKADSVELNILGADGNNRSSPIAAAADNYKVTGILADGRCLFRAIVHGACLRSGKEAPDENRQRELADDLRAQVVDEFLKRRDETEWFIEGDFDSYVKEIQHPYVWGGEPELLMASHVLKIPISVYMAHRSSRNLINIANYGEEYQKDNETPINVLFHGYGHYDILESLPELISTK